jgi:hypothetical protein
MIGLRESSSGRSQSDDCAEVSVASDFAKMRRGHINIPLIKKPLPPSLASQRLISNCCTSVNLTFREQTRSSYAEKILAGVAGR